MKVKTQKILSVFLIIMVIMTIFLTTTVSAEESVTTNNDDKFVIGMECAYAPYNWTQLDDSNGAVKIKNADGYAYGYDVEIAKRIAKDLDKELVIEKYVWDGLIPALQSGKIDAIIAGMSNTAERRESIDFTDSYYSSEMVIVMKKDSKYVEAKNLSDLSQAKLTGQLGTLHYDLLDEIPDLEKEEALEDFGTMIISARAGRIDGYISEAPGAISAIQANDDLTYISFEEGKGFSETVSVEVGIQKGNEDLIDKINATLSTIPKDMQNEIMENAISVQPVMEEEAEGETGGFFENVKKIIIKYKGMLLKGMGITLLISLVGTIIGLLIGILVGAVRAIPYDTNHGKYTFKNVVLKIINVILRIYIEIFRGTPMMVQALVIFYGIPLVFGIKGTPVIPTALFILSINTGAYMSEVVRGGIEGIDRGQTEAAKAIGMSHGQVMRNIVLPQAIRRILPATGNEFVINIKDTSVLNVITLSELFFASKTVASNTYRPFETYLITAVLYLVMTLIITFILRRIEHAIDGEKHFTLTSSSMPDHKLNHKSYGKKHKNNNSKVTGR